MTAINPNNLTPDQKRQVVGQCNFCWVSILALAAFTCGLTAIGYCSFVKRTIVFANPDGPGALCAANNITDSQCSAMTQNHGLGFFGWQTTVQVDEVDQLVCMSYTQYIPYNGK